MGAPDLPKKSTGKLMRQGQTAAHLYGNDPQVEGVSQVPDEPQELKP
jgi:hypothetical protein